MQTTTVRRRTTTQQQQPLDENVSSSWYEPKKRIVEPKERYVEKAGVFRFIMTMMILIMGWFKWHPTMFTKEHFWNMMNNCYIHKPMETRMYPPFPYTYQFCTDVNAISFAERIQKLREACVHLKTKANIHTNPVPIASASFPEPKLPPPPSSSSSSGTGGETKEPMFLLGPEYGINVWIAYDVEANECLVNPVRVYEEPIVSKSETFPLSTEDGSMWNYVSSKIKAISLPNSDPPILAQDSTTSYRCMYVVPQSARFPPPPFYTSLIESLVGSSSSSYSSVSSSDKKTKQKQKSQFGVIEITRSSPVTIEYVDENLQPRKRTFFGKNVCYVHAFLGLNDEFTDVSPSRFRHYMRTFKLIRDGKIIYPKYDIDEDEFSLDE